MKQYLSNEQTAKLIELGFEKPRCATMFWRDNKEVTEINYTIGELIEMLDSIPNNMWNFIRTSARVIKVEVLVFPGAKKDNHLYKISYNKELIDALYDIIVKLKEERVT